MGGLFYTILSLMQELINLHQVSLFFFLYIFLLMHNLNSLLIHIILGFLRVDLSLKNDSK